MKTGTWVVVWLGIALLAPASDAEDAACSAPVLRLVHLRDGLRSLPKNRNLENTRGTDIYKRARHAGVDLEAVEHPYFAQRFEDGRLFYVFYKTAERAVGDRPYLIQRIKKTERTWSSRDQEEPEVRVTYQVEVFKIFDRALKRTDQHYASYGIGEDWRREVDKEYEIGFGEIPGVCEGTAWPYDSNSLFEYVQRYDEDPGPYPDVTYPASTTWSLHVSFDAEGTYAIRCEELDIDAPESVPEAVRPEPEARRGSAAVRLTGGRGTQGIRVRESTWDDVRERLGPVLDSQTWPSGSARHVIPKGLVVTVDDDGQVTSVATTRGFAGQTDRGIRHGDTRARVLEVMGVPRRQYTDAWWWTYPGVRFRFDGWERVDAIKVVK